MRLWAGTTLGKGQQLGSQAIQRPCWGWACASAETQKALAVGLSVGQLASPNLGLLGQVMLDNKEHLPLPAWVAMRSPR